MTRRLEHVVSRLGELGLVPVGARPGAIAIAHHGMVDGQDVHVAIGAHPGAAPRLTLESAVAPALDLGLVVRRVDPHRAGGIAIDGLDDGEHHVVGDEPDRIRALLTGEIARAIRAIAELGGDVEVDDTRARVVAPRDPGEVPELLRALARLTSLLARSAESLPPAGPLVAAAVAWRHVAAGAGLTWRPSPLAMHGAWVAASTLRLGDGTFVASAWVGHPGCGDLGLALRRAGVAQLGAGSRGAAPASAPDARAEDTFGSLFTITARHPRAERLLDGPTRRALIELALLGEVRLDDTGLSLTDARPDDVPRAIDLMRRAVDGVVSRQHEAAGPYR